MLALPPPLPARVALEAVGLAPRWLQCVTLQALGVALAAEELVALGVEVQGWQAVAGATWKAAVVDMEARQLVAAATCRRQARRWRRWRRWRRLLTSRWLLGCHPRHHPT